jgi:hypothetical protein
MVHLLAFRVLTLFYQIYNFLSSAKRGKTAKPIQPQFIMEDFSVLDRFKKPGGEPWP